MGAPEVDVSSGNEVMVIEGHCNKEDVGDDELRDRELR
jgi:hypothetical protein